MDRNKSPLWMALRRSFFYGMFFSTGFSMLIQDYLGLEGYIVFVREHWVDLHYTVGLVLAAGMLYCWLGLLLRFNWLNEIEEKLQKEKEQ